MDEISPSFQAASQTATVVAGIGQTISGLRSQFAGRDALRAQSRFREQVAEREAEELAQLGQLEFDEAMRRATDIREEASLLSDVGVRNAMALRAEGRRIVGQIEARSAASGLRFSGSPAEVAAAAAGAAEFAANEELVETSRRADALLFEAAQLQRAGQERLIASRIGRQTALSRGRFEAASIAARAPSRFDILGSALKPLQELPTAITEIAMTFKASREARDFAQIESGLEAGVGTMGFLSPSGNIT